MRRLIPWNLMTLDGYFEGSRKAEGAIADEMNRRQKVVFSRTLREVDWMNTRLVRDAPEGEVARLKREPGKDILLFGSADLAATLMRHGLIDEYRIGLVPVVLGAGEPLFKPFPEHVKMRLVESKPLATGCVILSYRPIATPAAVAAETTSH